LACVSGQEQSVSVVACERSNERKLARPQILHLVDNYRIHTTAYESSGEDGASVFLFNQFAGVECDI
jgi:hypothetical protein